MSPGFLHCLGQGTEVPIPSSHCVDELRRQRSEVRRLKQLIRQLEFSGMNLKEEGLLEIDLQTP